MNEKAAACPVDRLSHVPRRFPAWVTWFAFGVGFAGTISLRLILLAEAYDPRFIRLLWYLGVGGNMCFFFFRSFITNRRRRLITNLDLVHKLRSEDTLCPEDYEALRYLVISLYASKERWNYFVIFFFSIAAIIWDIWIHW